MTIFAGAFAIQTILGYEPIDLPLLGDVDFFWFSAFSLVIITGCVRGARRHEVGAVDRGDARAGAARPARSVLLHCAASSKIGGLDALRAANPETTSSVAAAVRRRRETQRISRDSCSTPATTPWLGVLLCSPIIGLWYWCTDQYIVQRVLTARNLQGSTSRHDLRRLSQARRPCSSS